MSDIERTQWTECYHTIIHRYFGTGRTIIICDIHLQMSVYK